MLIQAPGPVLPDGSVLVSTAEGRICRLAANSRAFAWTDFGYPSSSRCTGLANAIVPTTNSAVFLTACDGHLYELDTGSNSYVDHGLPPNDPQAPTNYVAGCVGSPQWDPTYTQGPQFNILSTDGRLLQYYFAGSWQWNDLGCYASAPFRRSPLAVSGAGGTVEVISVTDAGILVFGTTIGANFTWLGPQSVGTGGNVVPAVASELALQISAASPAGYYIWYIDNQGSLQQAYPIPNLNVGQSNDVNWVTVAYAPPAAALIYVANPVIGNEAGAWYLYVQCDDLTVRLLEVNAATNPANAAGRWLTVFAPANASSFATTPLLLASATLVCFGTNDGSLVLVGIRSTSLPSEVVDAGKPPSRVALCLSGGGACGDFEVGVCEFLYAQGVRPDVLCGTSVGALNAGKLAEGGPNYTQGALALSGLKGVWSSLQSNSSMFLPQPWLNGVPGVEDAINFFTVNFGSLGPAVNSFVGILTNPFAGILQFFALPVASLINLINGVSSVASGLTDATSIFNLNPTQALIAQNFDTHKAAHSGVDLFIATVQLENGQLYFVTQSETVLGPGPPATFGLRAVILASCSIPAIFPPVQLNDGNHYVDGGVRATLPVFPAEAFEITTECFAVNTSFFNPNWSINGPGPFGVSAPIVGIGMRGIDCATDQIITDAVNPAIGFPEKIAQDMRFTLMRPGFGIHDSYTIDPGLISIAVDYGYMRAADTYAPSYANAVDCSAFADAITRLRLANLQLESQAFDQPFVAAPDVTIVPTMNGTVVRKLETIKREFCSD